MVDSNVLITSAPFQIFYSTIIPVLCAFFKRCHLWFYRKDASYGLIENVILISLASLAKLFPDSELNAPETALPPFG